MQRYFVNKEIIDLNNHHITISDKDYHHIKNVMRYKKGDRVIVCNDNKEYLSEIISITDVIELDIIEEKENNNELKCDCYIAHGLVRKEKCDEVLRRLVELGCNSYFNVAMERSVVKSDDKKIENLISRRETIVKEASEQSERGKLLKVLKTMSFKEFLTFSQEFDVKLVCFEDSGRSNSKLLKDYLKDINGKKVMALVGPEGGISPKEIKQCLESGFKMIGLGKRILRTETAPLYLMSVISYFSEFGE